MSMNAEPRKPDFTEVELVVFRVDDVPCALRIDEVLEIKRIERITPVHRAPEYIRGVVNLRGQIVSVIDLRVKLKESSGEVSPRSRLVVVGRGLEQIGLLIDEVEDAVVARNGEIRMPPSNVHGTDARFFKGVYQASDTLVAILNLHTVLEKDDVEDAA
jgi:purine-binding chemotaxis protein CheW